MYNAAFIADVDETLAQRLQYPHRRTPCHESMGMTYQLLTEAARDHDLVSIAVTNMPGPQALSIIPLLLGGAGSIHYAESGTVIVDLDRIRVEIDKPYQKWCREDRGLIVGRLGNAQLTVLEAGVMVNIILVNPWMGEEGSVKRFRERITDVLSSMPDRLAKSVKLSFGQDGNLADIRPMHLAKCGWSKLVAFRRIIHDYPNIPPHKVAYAGDSDGDLAIMKAIAERGGFIMCPGNASEQIKQLVGSHGGYVSDRPVERGTLEGLQRFLTERIYKKKRSSTTAVALKSSVA